MKQLPELRGVTAATRNDLYEVSPYSNTSSHVVGVYPNYPVVRFIPMGQGRFINDADVTDRRRVAVLGFKAASLLFSGRPMLGETITINGSAFRIVGTVDKITVGNNDYDDQKVYMPVSTMMELFPLKGDNIAQDALSSIQYQPAKKGDTSDASVAVHRVIAKRHGFDPAMKDAFNEWDTVPDAEDDWRNLYGNGYFSWRRGHRDAGIGRSGNHQYYAGLVTERTQRDRAAQGPGRDEKEHPGAVLLGGAVADRREWRPRDCSVGGIDGGAGCSSDGKMPGWDPPRLVPWSAALAMVCLTLSGIAAGLYPASKAAALDPVEALRRE